MKILVLNGSPRSAGSNTYCITDSFIKGMKSELAGNVEVETADVYAAHIEHCKGCFCCWTATPGKCVIHDDMEKLLPKMISSDLVIWSFPLYYFGMPSKMKAFLDRNLPLNLPFMEKRPDGGCTHPRRYTSKSAGCVLISTCGFSSAENNYEALVTQFDIMFPEGYTKILCPEGELFTNRQFENRTKEYLSDVCRAGKEYAQNKSVSRDTMERLNEPLCPPDAYEAMADAGWNIKKTKNLAK